MFWRYYQAGDRRGWLLPIAVAAELAWAAFLWRDYGNFLPWVRTAAVAAGAPSRVAVGWPAGRRGRNSPNGMASARAAMASGLAAAGREPPVLASPPPVRLDEDSWHCRVDPGNVVRVAGDDGVLTLPGAEHDVYVDDVIMVNVRTYQPGAPRHTQRHDRDIDAGRLEQPGQTSLARTAPGLGDDLSRNADCSAVPPRLV
jgi:hypothetical protein